MSDIIFLVYHICTFLLPLNSIIGDHKHLQQPIKKIIKWKRNNNQWKHLKQVKRSFHCLFDFFFVFFSNKAHVRSYLYICECWFWEPHIRYQENKYLLDLRKNVFSANKQSIDFNTSFYQHDCIYTLFSIVKYCYLFDLHWKYCFQF